ncbi:MAG: hypothetical protein JW941_06705 [Candidatus Coatesbacteria bacterium]|nr:hypothetical protein [Candidatus Coatesbacteria bacterium]
MLRQLKINLVVATVVTLAVISFGCNSKPEVDLRTAESTIRTYVVAHNSGDDRLKQRCGSASSLKGIFVREDFDVHSKKIAVPVDGIEYEILGSGPVNESVTRMFTTKDVKYKIRFTSKYDRDYEKVAEIHLECRRTVYDEEDTWQIL